MQILKFNSKIKQHSLFIETEIVQTDVLRIFEVKDNLRDGYL